MSVWTTDQLADIKGYISKGMSYSQIGAVFGVSRNAISGVVDRNKWIKSGAPSISIKANRKQGGIVGGAPGKTLREARKKARAKASVQPQEAVVVTVSADSAPDDISAPLMLSLMDLTNRTCRWPIGDPRASDFGFCGHETVSGSSYCSHHRERSIGQQTEREAA